MDPAIPAQSPDNSDAKPSFRKPANDAATRKYRRHTPVGGSDSSSGGSPKRRSRSPVYSNDRRRKDDRRDLVRDTDRQRSSRNDSQRNSDRKSHGTSHDYVKNGDSSRPHRHADEEDRGYHRSSRGGRESRSGTISDYIKHDGHSDRSTEIRRSGDKYSRDKSESIGYRSKDKDYWRNDKDSDRARDRRRSPDGFKNDQRFSREEPGARVKDSNLGRDSGSNEITVLKEKRKHEENESDRRKEKYHNDRESDKYKDVLKKESSETAKESDEQITSLKNLNRYDSEDEKPSSSSKQGKQVTEKFTLAPISTAVNQSETAQDLNAAKFAAMKAAELVNRNLVGGSCLTTDQKKKLLWGNKKTQSTEESSNRWDQQLFADRERQEKFNKLMSLRLPWYLWPIVGCEKRCGPRAQTQRDGCREEAEARDGPREAVHSWSSPKRWADCGPRSVTVLVITSSLSSFSFRTRSKLLCYKHNACYTFVLSVDKSQLVLYSDKKYGELCSTVTVRIWHVKCF